MSPIRIGIAGCGEVTQIIHLPTLAQLADRFTVTALCDVSCQVLEGVGERWNIAARLTDYRDLVARGDVDAVLVANPDVFHAPVTLAALAAGKHVLVEKPMCLTLREADEVAAAGERAGRVVQVGYMRRYAPAFLEACRLVRQMEAVRYARVRDMIGTNALIIRATSQVIRGGDVAADFAAEARRMREALLDEAVESADPLLRTAYGQMLGLSSHDLSAMRELLGMPQGVLYAAQRQGGRYLTAAFDYGDFVCQFETGVDNIPRFDAALEVFSRDLVLRVQYDTPYVLNLPTRLHLTRATGSGGIAECAELPAWGDPFKAEWQAFYENISEGKPPKTSPADFRQDLELFQGMLARMKG